MDNNLTSKTVHGLKWSYLSTGLNAVLQIAFTSIMARLLEPASFGLVAMAGVVLRFGSYFAQMGIGSALVQKKDITDDDISAAYTSSLFLGVIFFGLTWLFAPFARYFFNTTEVVPIVRIMAFTFILTGLSTTSSNLLRRNLDFRALAITEIVSYSIGYGGVGIALAFNDFNVWSLVVAALSQNALAVILYYLFRRHRLSFNFKWRHYKPLYAFGSRVSFISFLEFIGSNLDTLAIGHFAGPAPLGIYNRAFMLVNLPMQNLTNSFSRVLLPSFSRIQAEIQRLKNAYLSSIMLLASFLIPACIGVAVAAHEIVLLILGDKWLDAVPVLQVLAIATPLNLLTHISGVTCEATATLNAKIAIQIITITILGVLFYFMNGFGLIGFAFAIVIAEMIRHIAFLLVIKKMLYLNYRQVITAYAPGLISGVLSGGAIAAITVLLRHTGLPVFASFIIQLATGVVMLIIIFLSRFQRSLRTEIRNRLLVIDNAPGRKPGQTSIFLKLGKMLTAN